MYSCRDYPDLLLAADVKGAGVLDQMGKTLDLIKRATKKDRHSVRKSRDLYGARLPKGERKNQVLPITLCIGRLWLECISNQTVRVQKECKKEKELETNSCHAG
jgi:hypothetical protein